MPITTKIVSSNPAHGEVFVSDLRQVGGFNPTHGEVFVSDLRQVGGFTLVSFSYKLDHHDITEILLKVALNTITITIIDSRLYIQV